MWRQRSKIQDDGQVIDGEEDRQISHGLVGVKRVGGRRLRFKASEEPDFEQLRPTRAKWFTNKQTTYRVSERSIAGWPYREPSGFKKEDPFAYCWCTTKARRCSGPDRKVGSFWYPFTSSSGLVTWLWHYILHWLYTRIFWLTALKLTGQAPSNRSGQGLSAHELCPDAVSSSGKTNPNFSGAVPMCLCCQAALKIYLSDISLCLKRC